MANTDPEPEIIEVVEEILDNQMFLVAVAVGVIIGGIAFYLYMQSRGDAPSLRLMPSQQPQPTMDAMPQDTEYADDA
jgi:hypothetical protein